MLTPDPEFGGVALGSWVYDLPTTDGTLPASEVRGATWGIGSALLRVPQRGRTLILLAYRRAIDAQHLERLTQRISEAINS